MSPHCCLSPLLQRLWNNVWARLPERDKAYLETLNLEVEQFVGEQNYLGRVYWRGKNMVVSLFAGMPDGVLGQYIVAHELAHVVLHHPSLVYLTSYAGWVEGIQPQVKEAVELLADALVLNWGFEQEIIAAARSIDAYFTQNRMLLNWLVERSYNLTLIKIGRED